MASPSASASRKNTTLTALVLILSEGISAYSKLKGRKKKREWRS